MVFIEKLTKLSCYFILSILCLIKPTLAIDKVQLDIKNIISVSDGWITKDLKVYIENPLQAEQKIIFSLGRLKLPSSKELSLKLSCLKFIYSKQLIRCNSGKLDVIPLNSPYKLKKLTFKVKATYFINSNSFSIDLVDSNKPLRVINLSLKTKKSSWTAEIKTKNLTFKQLSSWLLLINKKLINKKTDDILLKQDLSTLHKNKGLLDLQVKIKGNNSEFKSIDFKISFKDININSSLDNKEILSENLAFTSTGKIQKNGDIYQLNCKLKILKGALFIDPYYIEFNGNETFSVEASTDLEHVLNMKKIEIVSPNYLSFKAKNIQFDLRKNKLNSLNFYFKSNDLKQLQKYYLNNLLSGTEYEALDISSGSAEVKFNLFADKQKLDVKMKELYFSLESLARFENLAIEIYWSNNSKELSKERSKISWDKLHYKGFPIQKTKIEFMANKQNIQSTKEMRIPLFDGHLVINKLELNDVFSDLKLEFDGLIEPISMELISQNFQWPTLHGKFSALIPNTHYSEKELKLGGKLWLNIFDGSLSFDKVVVENPMTNYSQLKAQVGIHNLSLEPLTQTYDFGRIEGRVEGYINQLVMTNWNPIAFDLYVATVDDDDLSHKISQKAVDNLSSMGGLSGILSQSFMSIFENFRYDKLGFGCHLNNGKCIMRGVEKVDGQQAYYLVKGGGLPRIDIKGYEENVDWNTLLERLQSIQVSNREAEVQ